MSLMLNGPSADYSPAVAEMMRKAAMLGITPPTPITPPERVTSQTVPTVPANSPMSGFDPSSVPTGSAAKPQLSVGPQQLSAATAALRSNAQVPVNVGMVPLEASPRPQPTQVQQAVAALPQMTVAPHHGFDWHRAAGILSSALAGATGQEDLYTKSLYQKKQLEAEQQFELAKAAFQSRQPRSVGHSLVQQGADGQYQTLYSEPEPFESYAAAQGFQPGTPEYAEAVKNYRLGAWSDDAVAAKTGFAGYRYDRMGDLQDDRLATSRRNTDVRVGASVANNMRSTGVSAANNIRTNTTARHGQDLSHTDRTRGQDLNHQDRTRQQDLTQLGRQLTDARIRGSAAYQGRGGHGLGAAPVAVGPNGHTITVRNGKWVDAQTGQPVQ